MRSEIAVGLLLVWSACKGTPEHAEPGAAATETAKEPDKPASTAMPEAIGLAPGGKLVGADPRQEGGTWTYAYPAGEPRSLAETERAALDGKGWKTVRRREAPDGLTAPVESVFASRDGKLVVAEAYRLGSELRLKVMQQQIQGLRVDAPPGYPAGFPFLPFGIVGAPSAGSKRITLVYNGELTALRGELRDAVAAAGWDCLGSTFESIAMCEKAGVEVDVALSSLSSNRQSLFVIPP